jgi:hypothetical protein
VIHNVDPNFNAILDYMGSLLTESAANASYSLQANTKVSYNSTTVQKYKEQRTEDMSLLLPPLLLPPPLPTLLPVLPDEH